MSRDERSSTLITFALLTSLAAFALAAVSLIVAVTDDDGGDGGGSPSEQVTTEPGDGENVTTTTTAGDGKEDTTTTEAGGHGEGDTTTTTAGDGSEEDAAASEPVPVSLAADFTISPNPIEVSAGEVLLTATNDDTLPLPHSLQLEGGAVTSDLLPGDSETLSLGVLEAGTYTVFCAVPGHRVAGMEAELIVS